VAAVPGDVSPNPQKKKGESNVLITLVSVPLETHTSAIYVNSATSKPEERKSR
jgi:hypothetical protein